MMRNLLFTKIMLGAAALLVLSAPSAANADDQIVCAQIMPCQADGSVLPPYDQGGCGAYYALICAKQYAEQNKNYNLCISALDQVKAENDKFRKHIKLLKRKNAKLMRGHRR
jgi:hypothetical protein